jgi:hypothetical protein
VTIGQRRGYGIREEKGGEWREGGGEERGGERRREERGRRGVGSLKGEYSHYTPKFHSFSNYNTRNNMCHLQKILNMPLNYLLLPVCITCYIRI